MPRYVNAHTHLELTALGGKLPENVPFLEWITALMAMRRGFSDDTILRGIDQGIQTLVDTGTVAVGDITASGLSVEPLLDSGLAGTVFLEVLGREREPALERLAAAQRRITSWRAREGRMRIGLSVHAPYSCHADLFRAVADWCEAEQVPLAIHIAESPAEAQYLRDGTGPFAELSERLYPHLPRAVATGFTPVGYLESLDALRVRPLLFHGVEVTEEDLLLLKQHDCAMVHCPRSNQRLLCERMPLECYLHHGITVALGTDSLASAPSLDLREEIDAAAKLHGTRVSRETLEVLATTGGARALGIEL
jgi:cytosine/adenosine deaminase-related metal-dependent hydrolase